MFIQFHAQVLGTVHDVFPVHSGCKALLLEFLSDALWFHPLHAIGTHLGNGGNKTGKFIAGIKRLVHGGDTRTILKVVGV